MSRYDVDVSMLLHYSFALEADTLEEAQRKSLELLGDAQADTSNIEIHTELGTDRGLPELEVDR